MGKWSRFCDGQRGRARIAYSSSWVYDIYKLYYSRLRNTIGARVICIILAPVCHPWLASVRRKLFSMHGSHPWCGEPPGWSGGCTTHKGLVILVTSWNSLRYSLMFGILGWILKQKWPVWWLVRGVHNIDTVLWTKVLANKCLRKYFETSKSSKDLLESLHNITHCQGVYTEAWSF